VRIKWRADGEVVITGTAEVVYSGQWLAPQREEQPQKGT